MSTGMSSSDSDVIHRKLEHLKLNHTAFEDLEDAFEIPRCLDWIASKNLERVTLQFPDSLLQYSARVAQILQEKLGKRSVCDCQKSKLFMLMFL